MAENEEKKEKKKGNKKLGYVIFWISYFIALIWVFWFLAQGCVLNLILGISLFLVGIPIIGSSIPLFGKNKLLGSSLYFIGLISALTGVWLLVRISWLSALATIFLIALGLFILIYFVLAPNNLFFTFVEEGTAKAVMRGGRFKEGKFQGGKFHKALIQWQGRTFDKDWKVIKKEEKHLFGGLRFYGFWPLDRIYRYKFEWTGLKPDGTPLYHPPEILDYILLKQDVYFGKTEEAEDKDLLPLNVGFILTISIINPYKALFEVQNWLEAVISRTIPAVRDGITKDTYDMLIYKQADIAKDIYKTLTKKGEEFQQFKQKYGVNVHGIGIQKIDPPEKQREVTLKKFVAEQDRKRIRIEADAEKGRIREVYGEVKRQGPVGELVRTLEAVEKSPEKGAKWILGIPGLGEAVSKIFSQRTFLPRRKPREIS